MHFTSLGVLKLDYLNVISDFLSSFLSMKNPFQNRTTLHDTPTHNSRAKLALLTEVHLVLKWYSALKRQQWHWHIESVTEILKDLNRYRKDVTRKLVTNDWLGLEEYSCVVQTLSVPPVLQGNRHFYWQNPRIQGMRNCQSERKSHDECDTSESENFKKK